MKLIRFSLLGLFALGLFLPVGTEAEQGRRLKVVTTLSTFSDIASSIGGSFVETKSIASPRFNPHTIQPKPTDVLRVKKADLFIHAGLDLEVWRSPLLDAAGRAEIRPGGELELPLSSGIKLLEVPTGEVSRSDGDVHLYGNPHYWLDPDNGLQIARLITAKLAELRPEHRAEFEANFEKFQAELSSKRKEWKVALAPYSGSEILAYHNEWVYLTSFLGLKVKHFLEPKPGISPGPKQVEFLKQYISDKKIPGIIQASFYPRTVGDRLAKETGISLMVLCQNVKELTSCPDYVSMLDFNVRQLQRLFSDG